MHAVPIGDFADWRENARSLLAQDIPPEEIVFHDGGQGSLFSPPTVLLPPILRPPPRCAPSLLVI